MIESINGRLAAGRPSPMQPRPHNLDPAPTFSQQFSDQFGGQISQPQRLAQALSPPPQFALLPEVSRKPLTEPSREPSRQSAPAEIARQTGSNRAKDSQAKTSPRERKEYREIEEEKEKRTRPQQNTNTISTQAYTLSPDLKNQLGLSATDVFFNASKSDLPSKTNPNEFMKISPSNLKAPAPTDEIEQTSSQPIATSALHDLRNKIESANQKNNTDVQWVHLGDTASQNQEPPVGRDSESLNKYTTLDKTSTLDTKSHKAVELVNYPADNELGSSDANRLIHQLNRRADSQELAARMKDLHEKISLAEKEIDLGIFGQPPSTQPNPSFAPHLQLDENQTASKSQQQILSKQIQPLSANEIADFLSEAEGYADNLSIDTFSQQDQSLKNNQEPQNVSAQSNSKLLQFQKEFANLAREFQAVELSFNGPAQAEKWEANTSAPIDSNQFFNKANQAFRLEDMATHASGLQNNILRSADDLSRALTLAASNAQGANEVIFTPRNDLSSYANSMTTQAPSLSKSFGGADATHINNPNNTNQVNGAASGLTPQSPLVYTAVQAPQYSLGQTAQTAQAAQLGNLSPRTAALSSLEPALFRQQNGSLGAGALKEKSIQERTSSAAPTGFFESSEQIISQDGNGGTQTSAHSSSHFQSGFSDSNQNMPSTLSDKANAQTQAKALTEAIRTRTTEIADKLLVQGGSGQANISIRDGNVGRVDVTVSLSNHKKLSIEIKTSSEEVKEKLEKQLESIKENLSSQKFQSVDIQLTAETQSFAKEGSKNSESNQQQNKDSSRFAENQSNSQNQFSNHGRQESSHRERQGLLSNTADRSNANPSSQNSAIGSAKTSSIARTYLERGQPSINQKGNLNVRA